MCINELYVVGLYENLDDEVCPTHVSPIIAKRTKSGYQRWTYRIVMPYAVLPISPVGEIHPEIDRLFPYPSYDLIKPRPISVKTQFICLSGDRVLVTEKISFIWLTLFVHSLKKMRVSYLRRTCVTAINCLR